MRNISIGLMKEPNLPNNISKIVVSFVDSLKSIYGDGFVSAVLYGSAASGEYARKYSNINLAIVLKNTSIASIKKAARIVNRNKFSAINPVFFTENYINKSLDVFPIEFLDIKENHTVIYGADPFKDIHVDLKNLRFQCEHELKSKILNIKRMYLNNKNNFVLKNILFKSLTSSLHMLRNLVRLKGKTPSYKKEDVLNDISVEFGVDISGLKKILDARNKNSRLSFQDVEGFFENLVNVLEQLSDKIDSL